MTQQAPFALKGRNPDVLTCIANLSNDEVFTPPEFAGRMLDTLAEGWAAANDGADIWADSSVTFLDPCTKSGVFLREIATRLIKGLEAEIPDLQARVDHILTKQLFGIGITRLTALLARRSLYCSKHATGPHSVAAAAFGENDNGNIWFERTEHVVQGDRCRICGAGNAFLERGPDEENHAYAFIHSDDIKARLGELFGGTMHFDVIIGNPPYQLDDGGVGGAMPIYQKFVRAAKALEPRFITMVTPSRWFAGGRGLDDFRQEMLSDRRLRTLVDWPKADEVFPGVLIGGGISYFLWDRESDGDCTVTVMRGGEAAVAVRNLAEHDIFVRDNRAVAILEKVFAVPGVGSFSSLMSGPDPFGFRSNFDGFHTDSREGDILLHYNSGGRGAVRSQAYVNRSEVTRNAEWVDTWKLQLNRVYNVAEVYPHRIVGKPKLLPPGEICTGSFLVAGPFETEKEASNAASYYETKFFRFLLHLRKINQDAARHAYQWVPLQSWDQPWTDKELYKKYDLTAEQIEYIEATIKPIELGGAGDE